ncbi:putative histidine kinase group protein [Podospora appendiculata]|uniref:Histidine kinase group protein n=1 Tax=Podospora appendiculata TaxID=314037 RepID=A0AAE0XIZ0_9PEZI|nr:putative histidine kinase group protein [Podospora appendiculata]
MHPPLLSSGIIDLLEADPRPSFIVALTPHPPAVVYTNPALDSHRALLDVIATRNDENREMWEWMTNLLPQRGSGAPSFSFLDVWWTRSVVQDMVVIGANESGPSLEPPRKVRLDVVQDHHEPLPPRRAIPVPDPASMVAGPGATLSASQSTVVPQDPDSMALDFRPKSTPVVLPTSLDDRVAAGSDMTQSLRRSATDSGWLLPDAMSEQPSFLDVIYSIDWAATPLGLMKSWPATLELSFNQILADSRPIAIYWGPSYSTIYNEAFSKLCGSRHPALLGMTVEDVWHESSEQLKDAMRSLALKQKGIVEDEGRFFVERESDLEGTWLEETYLKWSVAPIVDGNECVGFVHPVSETTSTRLWERRMKMLIDLGEVLVTARDVKSYWEKVIQELASVEPRYDIPLAILYSVEDDPDSAAASSPRLGPARVCRLAGALGVPAGHPIAPDTLNLQTGEDALSSLLRDALGTRYPVLLQTKDGTLPQTLLKDLQWRGFEGDPCRAAVICPIRPTKSENSMGILLLGLNPRRPYDNDYRQYISLLSQKLTTSLASVVLLEEETRRGRTAAEQAAYDQAMLKEKLDFQTKEANESIQMFEVMTEFVPVGMCFGDFRGNITFANDAWYKITGYPGTGPIGNQEFLSCVKDEDRQIIVAEYEKLKTTRNVEFEFRVKLQSNLDVAAPLTRNSPSFEKAGLDLAPIDEIKERHVLATAKAERASDGTIIRILTCLTDVTAHKLAAEEAVRRAQQAENLKRMAEFATVGMYDMDLDGRLLGANNVFFEMCGLEKVDPSEHLIKPWEACVHEEDLALLNEKLYAMELEDKPQNVEIRLKTTWTAEDGAGHKFLAPRWVQATLMPVRSTEGVIQSFTGCLSDVSLQKWQLEREKQRKEEAIESKRQQENFIDMTSHEMRNPLSAIIHCADAITATLTRVQELVGVGSESLKYPKQDTEMRDVDYGTAYLYAAGRGDTGSLQCEVRKLVESSIDSAETIVGCAQHQKRIVDDILTMSKLDSKLLAITPITVDPLQMVKEALKMFEVEARRVDINLSMVVDKSYRELGIKYLDFDPSRLKQVLINLLTNALKFTKTGPTRNVSVAISASRTRASEATSSVQFIPRSEEFDDEDYEQPALRGRGDPVFLMFEVKDTGQGLTLDEKKSLFQRFVQASSRTHVKYGGSGLGLFISRRLAELQNGAIGVASQPGVGSTFAFYIETYVPSESSIREAEEHAAVTRAAVIDTERASSAHRKGTQSGASGDLSTAPRSDASPKISGILVVEDNLINQQITRRGLMNMGFTVDVANHGLECLEKLRKTDRFVQGAPSLGGMNGSATPAAVVKFPLSVILMDIEMPVQDGLTCTRNIRELERTGMITGGRIPIIAVSANARMEQIIEAKEAGCDDVLVKPYRFPELLEKMRIVMGMVSAGE